MSDRVPPHVRSRMMAGIGAKDTKPELFVRRALHAAGYRYSLHSKKLPGRPDLVLTRHKAAIFVHGCFWHGHGCRHFKLPATRTEFWAAKIEGNRARDDRAIKALLEAGWRVAVVWECIQRNGEWSASEVVEAISSWLESTDRTLELH